MDSKRPFSSSTLTTNEGHSRPRGLQDRLGSRITLPRRPSRRGSVLEDMYKNPQQYAGILEDPSNHRRGVMKQVLLLSPMFSSEFCRAFSFVFMLVNLEVLGVSIGQSVYCSVAAGVVCVFSIFGFRWLHKRLYYSKKFKVTAILCYNAFLVVGLGLVLGGNVEQYSSKHYSENGTFYLSDSPRSALMVLGNVDNNLNVSSHVALPFPKDDLPEDVVGLDTSQTQVYDQNETDVNRSYVLVPFDAALLVSLGYVMTTSSLVGGHYILQSLFLSMSHSEDRNCVISIIAVTSTTGTCAMGILGAVNVSTSWMPSDQTSASFFGSVTTLAGLTIALVLLCTMCSVVSSTWPCGVTPFHFRRHSSRHSNQGAMLPTERRSTRTAQEIYDECAPLLSKMEHTRERKERLQEHEDDLELSQSESAHEGDSTESAQSEVVARYSAPAQVPSTSKETVGARLARRRHFFLAVLLVFLTSGAWVTMEFYSSFYLLHEVYNTGSSEGVSLAPRAASIGVLLMSISQLPAYILNRTSFSRVGAWKKMALGVTMLGFMSTLGLALSSSTVAYFVAMFFVGPVRVLAIGLPLLLTSQPGRSQAHTQASLIGTSLLSIPTTLLLSTIPAAYTVTSLVSSTLIEDTNLTEISVYVSATLVVLVSCCFYILI